MQNLKFKSLTIINLHHINRKQSIKAHGPNALLSIDMSTLYNILTAFSGIWTLLAVVGCDLRHMVANGSKW